MTAAAVLVMAAMGGGSASASGGGGCGRQVTDARTDTVVIRDYCFGPTITRVDRGETVTFINKDSFEHSVLGANGSWGSFRGLRLHGKVQYRFTRPGVYPFVCTYHVGMVGVVVVGAGVPRTATGTTTDAGPVVNVPLRARTTSVRAAVPVAAAESAGQPERGFAAGITAIAIGALLLSAGFAWASRVRRRRTLAA